MIRELCFLSKIRNKVRMKPLAYQRKSDLRLKLVVHSPTVFYTWCHQMGIYTTSQSLLFTQPKKGFTVCKYNTPLVCIRKNSSLHHHVFSEERYCNKFSLPLDSRPPLSATITSATTMARTCRLRSSSARKRSPRAMWWMTWSSPTP